MRRRSDGVRHVRGATRWAVAGSAVSAIVLGLGYAHALPHVPSLTAHHGSDGGGSDGTGTGVQPPTLPGGGAAHTTTGGS
ncbi:hypothetical protein ACFW1A_24175 [Kitasatospora sp. NPDC058965]|uniref:hypothetical protein n=1 Tax=Kitasatospora sp. NPDC058965 TaxID=3346682 RepID=UPI00368772EB